MHRKVDHVIKANIRKEIIHTVMENGRPKSHFQWTETVLYIVIMVPLHYHCILYTLVMCVHNVLVSIYIRAIQLYSANFIPPPIRTYTNCRHSLEDTSINERERTKGECLGRYANGKHPNRWVLVKNVNLKPTMNSTASGPADGNNGKRCPSFKGATLPLTQPPDHEQ